MDGVEKAWYCHACETRFKRSIEASEIAQYACMQCNSDFIEEIVTERRRGSSPDLANTPTPNNEALSLTLYFSSNLNGEQTNQTQTDSFQSESSSQRPNLRSFSTFRIIPIFGPRHRNSNRISIRDAVSQMLGQLDAITDNPLFGSLLGSVTNDQSGQRTSSQPRRRARSESFSSDVEDGGRPRSSQRLSTEQDNATETNRDPEATQEQRPRIALSGRTLSLENPVASILATFDNSSRDNPLLSPIRRILQALVAPMGITGDYVTSQEAFDNILSQLMEMETSRNTPVPASEDILQGLTSEKVGQDFADKNMECVICKDTFELEQDYVTLICSHIFHKDCVMFWLRVSGTCPICRHSLLPDSNTSTEPQTPDSRAPLQENR